MGVVAWNYIVDDYIIEDVINDKVDIDDYIDSEKNNEFNILIVGNDVYGTDLKKWNETYRILKIIDKSEQKVFNEFYNVKNTLETELNGHFCFYNSRVVKKIWKELKNYSVGDFERFIDTDEIITEFNNNKELCELNEKNKKYFVMEFFELYKSFYTASNRNKGIITVFG